MKNLPNIKSWSELDKILKDQTNTEKGDLFERFCKALLATHRQFCAEHVYLRHEIPIDEKEHLRLPSDDLGHDGLFIKYNGDRVLFQAKYRAQEHLTHTELSTFFNISEFAYGRLIIRTTDLSRQARVAIEKKDNTTQIDAEWLSQLDEEDFKAINSYMQGRGVITPKPRSLWPIQQKAIDELLAQPHDASFPAPERATCVMPCATGKTLVAMRYSEAISAKRIVILLPSLMLVEQAIKDWCRDSKIPTDSFSFHVICSQKGRGERTKDDSIYIPKSDLAFVRSTKPSEVTDYLKKSQGKHQIIFCTYQSTQVLIEALKEEEQRCDLIIFDEAHRTAGRAERAFSLALSDENIKATHRLYLTATPKHIDFQKKSQDGEYKTAFSMDDEAVYGQKVMIDYREAIENDRICDYKVIVSVLKASEIARSEITQSEVYDENHPDKDFDALSVAHEIALDRVMLSHGVKKIISFHKLIEDARSFAEETSSCMPFSLHCQYIKGMHTRNERADILKVFSDTEYGLLSNARCLTEGINIPSVDCVAFLSPKRSKVDIIQAIGRAMRKDPKNDEKKVGYVLLPLLVEDGEGESEEEAVAATNFDEIWDVLGSLKEFDPILAKVFNQIAEDKGANKDSNPFDLLNDHIEIIGTCLSSESLKKEIGTRIIDRLIISWHLRYGEMKVFKETHDHCHCPNVEPYKKTYSWASKQLSELKTCTSKDELTNERYIKLKKIGFPFNGFHSTWFKKIELYAKVSNKGADKLDRRSKEWVSGSEYAIAERFLRSVQEQYQELDDERKSFADKYNIKPFRFKTRDEYAIEHLATLVELAKYNDGDINISSVNKTILPDGQTLGKKSVSSCRYLRDYFEDFTDDVKNKITKSGFDLDPIETYKIKKFKQADEYYKINGHVNVPQGDKSFDGLAVWIEHQRENYKDIYNDMTLPKDKREVIDFLDERNMTWNQNHFYSQMVTAMDMHNEEFGEYFIPQKKKKDKVWHYSKGAVFCSDIITKKRWVDLPNKFKNELENRGVSPGYRLRKDLSIYKENIVKWNQFHEENKTWNVPQRIKPLGRFYSLLKDSIRSEKLFSDEERSKDKMKAIYDITGLVKDDLLLLVKEKETLPFNEARAYVRKLGLKSETEWRKYIKNKLDTKKPDNIPAAPDQCKGYKRDWNGWKDWLGTSIVTVGEKENV